MTMERIYKYPLRLVAHPQLITLPRDATVVHFAMQGDTPTFWAVVDPYSPDREARNFVIRGTGHDLDDELRYIGTTQHGPLVWHLFEEK